MHQTYWFRVSVPKDADTETLKDGARAALEDFMNSYGDENNWYQEEMLLLQDGTVLQLCDDDDPRGRESLAEHFLTLPTDERWTKAMHSAAATVALDLGIGGSSSMWFGEPDKETQQALDLTTEQLTEAILREIPLKIASLYQELAAGPVREKWPGQRAYQRSRCSLMFEMFYQAEVKPFAAPDTPYNYPCYDLTQDATDDEQIALLAVDIHT